MYFDLCRVLHLVFFAKPADIEFPREGSTDSRTAGGVTDGEENTKNLSEEHQAYTTAKCL